MTEKYQQQGPNVKRPSPPLPPGPVVPLGGPPTLQLTPQVMPQVMPQVTPQAGPLALNYAMPIDLGGERLARLLKLTDALQGMNSDDLYSLNLALTNAVEGIARMDFDGRFVWVNAAYCKICGHLPQELIGKKPEDVGELVLKEDVNKHHQAQLDMLAYGRAAVELRGRRPNGDLYWRQLTCIPATDRNGRIVGHFKFVYDITHRKLNEAAVKAMTEDVIRRFQQWHKIVDLSPDATVTVCDRGSVLTWNRAAAAMLGWTEEQAMGKSIHSLLTAGNRRPREGDTIAAAGIADDIAAAMVAATPGPADESGATLRKEYRNYLICRRDGKCNTVDAFLVYWPDGASENRHCTGFFRESTGPTAAPSRWE